MEKRSASVPLIFERMTLRDIDAVAAIEQAAYTSPWTRTMFESELWETPFSFPYVVREEANRRIVGYVLFWLVYDELHLMNLAVDPVWRRKGIGQELLRFALETGARRAVLTATLEVRASNLPAQSLYKKLGFYQDGIRRGYYREPKEDALLFRCDLNQEMGEN